MSTESVKPSKDLSADSERGWKVSRNRPSIRRGRIVEDPLPNNVRWLANVSDANDKQTNHGLSRITSPQGILSCYDRGSIPRSLVPNIIHRLSLPSAMAYATRTPPLTCQVRDAVPVIRWREALTNAIRKTGSCSITTKENACLCIRRRTFTRNRVWQKDNRRCKLMVYTERRCTPLWSQKLMLHKL